MKKTSLSEDTLLRMLVISIAETIARLTAMRTAGQFQEVDHEIDRQLEELLGIKPDLVHRLKDENIVEMLTLNEVLDIGSLYSVAELFSAKADLHKVQGQAHQVLEYKTRALNLYLEIAFAGSDHLPELKSRIDSLSMELMKQLPEDLLFSLFSYYELIGDYESAERALDRLCAISEFPADVVSEQIAFYHRLLEKSDADLIAGGKSRDDILATMKGIRKDS